MSFLTDTVANAFLNAIFSGTALPGGIVSTSPFKLRITSTAPTSTTAGTLYSGSTDQTVAFTTASGTSQKVTNTAATVTFTSMTAGTVLGGEIFDAVPTRKAWGPLNIAVGTGDTLTFAISGGVSAQFV